MAENILAQEMLFIRRANFSHERYWSLTVQERDFFLNILQKEIEEEEKHAREMEEVRRRTKY